MTGLCGQDAECTDSSRLQQILPGSGISPANLLTCKSSDQIRADVCAQNK